MSFSATSSSTRRRLLPSKHKPAIRKLEVKFYDTAYAITAIPLPTDASGGMADPSATSMISTPAVGDTSTNREGGQIFISAIEVRGKVEKAIVEAATGPTGGQTVFVALVQDTQTNGAQMNSENCFSNLVGTAASACDVMRNLNFRNRFKVLRQEWFNMSPITLTSSALNDFSESGQYKHFQWYIKLKQPIKVNFNSTTPTVATIASVVDNCLHLISYTTTAGMFLSYNARIRFTD